ncbi:hypothetical protein GCM10023063_26120 [Arthrobacter methylotrophus]
MVRILDAKGAQIVVTAAQGPFDGAVSHVQHRDLGHPFLSAQVPGGQPVGVRMDEYRRRKGSSALDTTVRTVLQWPCGGTDTW